jgi:hypothetical protein
LAFDTSGNLYVANGTAVSEFAPGSTTAKNTITGLGVPKALAFDQSGNLYVANSFNSTVSKFAPGSTTASATLTGLNDPVALAFDQSGNLYVANYGGNMVSKFAPGSITSSTSLTGLSYPDALTFDTSGNLYVANSGNGSGTTVSEFAPGNTTPCATLSGLNYPKALAFDQSGNLFVANYYGNTASKFAPGNTMANATLTGLSSPDALAFDQSGNLFVANGNTLSEFSPAGNSTISTTGGVVIRSSQPTRPMSLGGANNAVAGVNLTDAELSRIFTTFSGTITIGDSSQTGNITLTTAMVATTAGASTVVVQAVGGSGQIILDDGAGVSAALNGNGGTISLTAGTGGIAAASASNAIAEIATTGHVTLDTAGPIGSSTNRIQFGATATPAQIVVGSVAQPTCTYLDGLGNLNLGNVTSLVSTGELDVTARGNITVLAGATLNTGPGRLSLAADTMADGTGDNGVGNLSLLGNGTLDGGTIALRGADMNLDPTATVGGLVAAGSVTTLAGFAGQTGSTDGTGSAARFDDPFGVAVDSAGNVFVADEYNDEIRKITPSGVVTTLAGSPGQYGSSNGTGSAARFGYPAGVAVDSTGNVYVADTYNDEIRKITPSGVVTTLAGSAGQYGSNNGTGSAASFDLPQGVAVDSVGNVYVADTVNNEIRKISPSGVVTTLAGSAWQTGSSNGTGSEASFAEPSGVAVDSAGNIYVGDAWNEEIRKITPSGVFTTLAGLVYQSGSNDGTGSEARFAFGGGVTVDSVGNVYVADEYNGEIRKITPSGVVTTLAGLAYQSGSSDGIGVAARFDDPMGVVVDSMGNVYVADAYNDEIRKITPVTAFAGQVTIRSSVPSRPMSLGGGNNDVTGINLTDAELACIETVTGGTVTIGDSTQTGNITFTTARVATTAAANTVVVQATGGSGQITLDDQEIGPALDGNGGNVSLTAGTGGIVAASANDTFAEIAATGNVSLDTAGPIGSSGSRIQFDAIATPAQIIVGSVAQPTVIYLDGLGNLNLGNISCVVHTGLLDVTARGNVTVIAGATLDASTSALSLVADTKADGTGDDGVGTLSVLANGTLFAGTVALSGADMNLNPAATVGVPASAVVTTVGAARFFQPPSVAVDSTGNVYVVDYGAICEISPSGVVTTLAGSALLSGSSDGTGSAARFDDPAGVAVDSEGNVYVADTWNDEIREISPSGVVTTLAGSAGQTGSSDGTGSAARFSKPFGVAVDTEGNVYVADTWNDEIREISPSGVVTTLAGSAAAYPGSSDGIGSAARFDQPYGVAVDTEGNVYVADSLNNEVRKITSSGVVSTLAGCAGQTGSSDGAGSAARFDDPTGVAVDSTGNVYVADESNDEIRKITPSGVVTTLAGSAGQYGSRDGTSKAARFSVPAGVALDSAGNVYVADQNNNDIRKITMVTPFTSQVTIRSSVPSRPMSLGGGDNDVAGINLTDAELACIQTAATGTVTIGDGTQTGNITFKTARVATTAGAGTVVVQATGGPGQIVLDDQGTGPALDGNGGTIQVVPGTGGVQIIQSSSAAGDVAIVSNGFTSPAAPLSLTLNFASTFGAQITLVDNTATPAVSNTISGTFSNLASGGTISATYNGTTHVFTANYAGGDGNDLVLTDVTPPTTTTVSSSQTSVVYGTAVTFTATVSAQNGSTAPTAGSLDFFDTTTSTDLGLATLGSSTGTASIWTLATGVKTFHVTAGDIITATYSADPTFLGSSGTTVQTITTLPITVTAAAATKSYDGTTFSTATPTITTGSLVSGDAMNFTETYDTKNVGTGKTLTAAGSVSDGNGGNNYAVTFVSNAMGQITARAITVTAATGTKVYDATTSSTATPTITAGSLASGDTAVFSETFDTKNAGTGKTLAVTGFVKDGNSGTNYTVTFAVNTTGSVTARAITVTAAPNVKTYDGTTSALALPTITAGSLATGDTAAFSETFDTKNVGISKTLTAAGSVNDGNSGNNYTVTFAANTTGVVTARPITVTAVTDTKTYDGTTTATATPAITSVVVTTLAGAAGQGGSSDGTGSAASFDGPDGVAVDSAGNVYVADYGNDEIRKITPSGVVTTLAGAAGQGGSSNGAGSAARFDYPGGVAVDSAGNVYVADSGNDEIRKITPSGVVTTLAGAAGQQGFSDGTGSAARFDNPGNVAVDSEGNVYVADSGNDEIRKITPLGGVTTLAGSAGQTGSSDGTGSAARFDYPTGVAVDSIGSNVYVGDCNNDEVRKITSSGVVTTLAGSAGQTGSSDGTGSAARFDYPTGVAVDNTGNVYVADWSNDKIRKITPSGVVSTLAGSAGQTGSSDGIGSAARFYDPCDVRLDSAGDVYVADYGNDEIRLVSTGLATGDTAAFTEAFDTKNAGTGKMLAVAGSVNDGNGGNNYTVSFAADTTGQIIARAVTVTAAPNLKVYDGTASASALPAITAGNLVTGDTAAFSESYDSRNAGIFKTLSPAGSVNDGNGGNNYAVIFVTTTIAAIYPRAMTVTAATATKVYDGTLVAAATPTITSGSLAIGDTAAFSETYNTPDVGTGWTLTPSGTVGDGNAGANYSVTFVANTTGAITQTVDHFLLTASPTGITAGNNFILVVTAEDASDNIVTGYAGTVGFSSSDLLEPEPAGNLTFQPGSGVASTLATLETAGSWSITAMDISNSSIYGTTTVTVAAASASKVVFGQPPTPTPAGATITSTNSQPVTVDVEDQYGNLVSSYNGNVTVAIAFGPSGGKLLGTATVQTSGGVASFSNLSMDQAGAYTLSAGAAGVGSTTTSNSFNVTAATASQLAFTTQPANTPGAQTMANVKVAVEDQYGNTVTTDNSSVTLTLNAATSGGGGVLKGTAVQAASGGVATFSSLSIVNPSNNSYSAAGTGYTLSASDTDAGVVLTAGKSTAFNTTLIVTSCTMTPTGFVATFSQPFKVATTPLTIGPNLYSAVATNNLPVNVSLIGSNEGTVRGSLVLSSTDTQITFVATTLVHSTGLPIAGVSSPDATSGILAPDGYTVVLDSTSTSFVTANGQLLDGTDSGTGGTNFNQFTAVDNSADVDVVIPSFARGPSSSAVTGTVNVPNLSTPIFASSAMSIASSSQNGATESGNTVTITTSSAHGLVAGQTVLIAGFSGAYSGYNGTFTVASVPATTTFTYTDSTTGLGKSGGGTATGYGLSESGSTVTVWTTVANQLTVNEPVTISGAGVAGYNGTFTVTSLPGGANGTTFTYTDTNASLANSGGGMAALARGIPISLSGPTGGVTSGTFTLTYSSSDLTISGAVVDPSLAASYGATLSLDASSTAGNAIIDFSTTTPLPSASSAPILLGGITATVPSTAYYKAKDLLHFSSVTLKAGGSSVATIGADALYLVTFPGDASGDGTITSADVLDMARVVAGADAGFAAYPLIDPDVIGDLLGDGTVDGPDGALLGRYVNGVTTPQVPVYPGAPVNKLSVADPTVSIPSTLQLGTDGIVTAPATVADTALPVLPQLTASVVAGPVAAVSAGAVVKAAGGVSLYSGASAAPAQVLQHVADGLFAALGGAVDVAELAILGSGEQSEPQALAAQMIVGASAQADLNRLLWESGDSSWLDGERDWLF